MDVKKIYYFSSTHWDREWYQTFQKYRFRLVKVLDEAADVLASDEAFKLFYLDGQIIPLLDYLEIRPEKKESFVKLIKEGRIKIGPWYTMPDEFLVSGESLIYNLKLGADCAKELGVSCSGTGYICDMFGHIAQMPQILKGFNLSCAVLGRGTNDHDTRAFFNWQSPDGSAILTFKVPEDVGYGTFCENVIWPQYFNNEKDNGALFERAEKYVESEIERAGIPFAVLMDGMDHERIHPQAPLIVKHLREKYGCEVVFSCLEELPQDIGKYIPRLQTKAGELNETARRMTIHNALITHTLSSRADVKLKNDVAQVALEKYACPMSALASMAGKEIPKGFIDTAYRFLLTNHAHDSICGCSIDEVYEDVHYRYNQCLRIAAEVSDEAFALLTEWEDGAGDEFYLNVFNTLPFDRKETLRAEIPFSPSYPTKYYEQVDTETINSFKIFDSRGKEIPYQVEKIQRGVFYRLPDHMGNRKGDVYTVLFEAEVPAMGFAQYKVSPWEKPVRYMDYRYSAAPGCENEHIKLTINADGTFDIEDKATGKRYFRLHSFIDDGEAGDGWYHYNPVEDRECYSLSAPCRIERLESGPVGKKFRVTREMRIPSKMIFGSSIRRSDDYETLLIHTDIFVGSERWVDVETTVENNCKDHRLRLKIPTGIPSLEYYADQSFAFVKRPVGIREGTEDWKECAKYERQFQSIAFKKDEKGCGIAFISAGGIHEVAALVDDEGSLLFTLFRSFKRTLLTNGQTGCQLYGDIKFRYRIMPFSPGTAYSDLIRVKERLAAECMAFKSAAKSEGKSFLRLDSRHCILSMLEHGDEGKTYLLRLYNCSDESDEAKISFFTDLVETSEVNLAGEVLGSLPIADGKSVTVKAKPWQIKTIKVRM
jgi:alpha-mannosidase